MTVTVSLAPTRTAARTDLAANALIVAVPILRAEVAERWLGRDPLDPVARLLAGQPWLGHLFALPLDQAVSLSRAITLLGIALAILCGLALFRLARRLGFASLAAMPPAIACEFAPGLPAPGFDRSGLAMLALLLLLQAHLHAAGTIRSPIPRIAAATALFAIVLTRDQAAGSAAAVIVLGVTIATLSPRAARQRTSFRLIAGTALGLCLAFPFAALDLLVATPSNVIARFQPLIAAYPFGPVGLTRVVSPLEPLLPSCGLAVIGLASVRRGAAILPAALGLALIAGLAPWLQADTRTASPVIPVAIELLVMLALATRVEHPIRAASSVFACAVAICAILVWSGLPFRVLPLTLAAMLFPAAALALGRGVAGVVMLLETAGAWAMAP